MNNRLFIQNALPTKISHKHLYIFVNTHLSRKYVVEGRSHKLLFQFVNTYLSRKYVREGLSQDVSEHYLIAYSETEPPPLPLSISYIITLLFLGFPSGL